MAEKYVVYVSAPPAGEVEAAGRRLAALLKLDPNKVEGLLRRLPGLVTRPVSEREATVAAQRFQQAGFTAEVRPASRAAATLEEPAVEPASQSPASPLHQPVAADESPAFAHEDDQAAEPLDAAEPASQLDSAAGRGAGASDPALLAKEKLSTTRPPAAAGATDAVSPAQGAATVRPTARVGVSPTDAAPPPRTTGRRRKSREAAVDGAAPSPRRRGSLRSKLLSTAIIPVLLTIVGALAATWFTARPALYDQLLESARNPAIATAATLSSTLERAGGEGIDHLQLLETILITRQAFARQNLSFILATDTAGNPYSGSFLGGSSFPEESLALQNAVRERAVHAVEQGATGRSGWAEEGATSKVEAAGGQTIEIVAQPLMSGDRPVGAVVVGVADQAVTAQVNRIVINVLLFSLIPLLLAIIIAITRARRLTNNVLTLTRRADEISRGDLDEPIELRSNDELDDLSAALERMRVSMSGALERLRRRR